jgi:hypothetical protein
VDQHKKAADFNSMFILTKALWYMGCFIKETIEMRPHPRDFSKHLEFYRSWPRYLLSDMIKQYQNCCLEMTPNLSICDPLH